MKICNICSSEMSDYEDTETDDSIRICLGTTLSTYDLCKECARKVNGFIEENSVRKKNKIVA